MIDINLIPPALRRKSKAGLSSLSIKIPQEILYGVGGAAVFLVVFVHLALGLVWLTGMGHLSLVNGQWQQILPARTVLNAISNDSHDINKKIGMIEDMTVKKSIVWSQKLNAISDALPRGLWLRKMLLDKTGLTLEGSVVSKNHNEITHVGNFIAALKKNEAFMKDFASLEVNSIQRGKRSSMEVADFIVMAKLK